MVINEGYHDDDPSPIVLIVPTPISRNLGGCALALSGCVLFLLYNPESMSISSCSPSICRCLSGNFTDASTKAMMTVIYLSTSAVLRMSKEDHTVCREHDETGQMPGRTPFGFIVRCCRYKRD